MCTFNGVFAVIKMILRPRAARLISRFFFGTTDETTRILAFRRRRMLATLRAFSEEVGIFEARSIRDREAKAIFVKELLTSMRRKSGFVARLRPLRAARSLALCLFIVPAVYAALPRFAISFAKQICTATTSSCRFS